MNYSSHQIRIYFSNWAITFTKVSKNALKSLYGETDIFPILFVTSLLNTSTAVLTYYYDPAILQNRLTPLSIFRDLALRKGDSKKFMFLFYVFYRVYTNIPKLFGLVVYYFTDFLGDSVAHARFGTKIQ